MSPLEKETKLVLSPDDFRKLQEFGNVLDESDQLNIYFHDPGRLTEGLGYFRVRFESGRDPVATLKIPSGWKGNMREMVEVERPLSELGPDLFPRPKRWVVVGSGAAEGFMEHFQALGITRLRRLGWMRNHRTLVELPPLGAIELDRTSLPDGSVSFEAEIEEPVEARHSALVQRVRELAPSAEFSRVGKFTRFMLSVGLV